MTTIWLVTYDGLLDSKKVISDLNISVDDSNIYMNLNSVGAQNLGTGVGILAGIESSVLSFKSFNGVVSTDNTVIIVDGANTPSTATNIGATSNGLFIENIGQILTFKDFTASTGVSIDPTTTTLVVANEFMRVTDPSYYIVILPGGTAVPATTTSITAIATGAFGDDEFINYDTDTPGYLNILQDGYYLVQRTAFNGSFGGTSTGLATIYTMINGLVSTNFNDATSLRARASWAQTSMNTFVIYPLNSGDIVNMAWDTTSPVSVSATLNMTLSLYCRYLSPL